MTTLWPYLATMGLLAALSWFAWQRRSVPGARPFVVACLASFLWAGGSAAALAATDPSAKLAWYKFLAVWLLPATTAALCFALEYVQPGRWLTRRNLMLLAIPSGVALILIVTNDLHHWLLRGFEAGASVALQPGPAWWPMVGFALSLYLVNLAAFAWLFARSPRHRPPVALMIAGGIAGRLAAIAGLGGELMALRLDLPLLTVLIPSCCYAIALFGFRILDPLPAAVQSAVEQMREGMVVFGPGWQVLGLNPAAEQILGVPASSARGKSWPDLLPGFPDLRARLADSSAGPPQKAAAATEVTLATGSAAQHYVLDLSSLLDFRGPIIGYLLLLHDVTEQRRAQAQILEQQRALATLHERERLARELHDGTGQVLGYVSLQTQAIVKWMHEGDTARAEAQLARLTRMAQEAHADLRDSILSLRTGSPECWSLLAALEQHLAAYRENYGICAELIVSPDLAEGDLAPGVSVQLFRVIQEALTNARKHSQTKGVYVTLAREGARATIVVADDGAGFSPEALPADGQKHFGLAFMAERMAQIEGDMAIESEPGAGTRVVLHAPLMTAGEEGT
jgi:signal transduction histidine kinase